MPVGGETPYTDEFYSYHREGALRSAHVVVPLVLRLLKPQSVVDVGCGTGAWLSVFQEHGVADVYGIDGDWVDRQALAIPPDRFSAVDLQQPFSVDRRFDLAVCLEVGEHLRSASAGTFVDSLTRLAPAVLFSAAIPYQGGTRHINEQWPDYWVAHFADKGYASIDCIRRHVWQNQDIEWYYAQNVLLFATSELIASSPLLQEELERTAPEPLALVHPRMYLETIAEMRKLLATTQDLSALIPRGDSFILVDQDVVRRELAAGLRAIPFLERDGQYWGPPGDDRTAIQELERLRGSGASFIIFAWPAFWWLEYYSGLHDYLKSRFIRIANTERLVAFDLRG
jgi:SAM-dependent methyltransferase